MKYTGVTARGIVSPIFSQGDDLITLTCETIINASKGEGFPIEDGDIIAITESVVARTQGNYVTSEQIAKDIKAKFGGGDLGLVFPILSRNRFSILLKSIAMAVDTLYVQLSFPADEVGNELVSFDQLLDKGVNPYSDSFDEKGFREVFGNDTIHPFTGIDYISYYKSLGDNIKIIFSNDPCYILNYTKKVLTSDIHSRHRSKKLLKSAGAEIVLGLDDILCESVDGSGFCPDFGLLGSNMATEGSVKLFPRDAFPIVEGIQKRMQELCGKRLEVMVYGDGCFKDPVGGIWEFADPVVSPAYTKGLEGKPNELKMKYFADNEFRDLKGEALADALKESIRAKQKNLIGDITSQGTTPRRYTDLIGSLCDLVSGSGDRGTPIVLIKNYFSNYAD
ncbi:coenzyme F420-0:L-glutamate ligase [Clostridiaceae bacterium OttesenSCG-928-D20]|nr:coenzyme F420-0:L-glutamate ligase [Clostridiaceae bacterium OttesenSCG-928-D20]